MQVLVAQSLLADQQRIKDSASDEAQADEKHILDKEFLLIFMKLLNERYITTNSIWEILCAEAEVHMNENAFDLDETIFILDCYFDTLWINTDFIKNIAKYIIKRGYT